MNFDELTQGIKECECGKEHNCPIEHIIVGEGVLSQLGKICDNSHNILLVADQNTFQVCGQEVKDILKEKITSEVIFQTGTHPLIPNEETIAEIEAKVTGETDLILGIGSGVINDLCKYVSYQHTLPQYIVATAPSMDGYASVGSALILKGMKVTVNCFPPKAILADTRILKDAPFEMIQSGYGDIIGKYSCLNDWKLGALIRGEYFCQKVYDLVYDTVEEVRSLVQDIKNRDEKAVGALMEALVTVGIAMSYVGNSRPASGSEHHFSHYFEITGILNGTPYFTHGIDVFYSTVLTSALREKIAGEMPKRREFNRIEWEEDIKRIYQSSAQEVIALQDKLGWYDVDDSAQVYGQWEEISNLLREVPTEDEILGMLREIGLDYGAFLELYGEEKIQDGVLYAKDLKDRYSVLWLYYQYFR